MGVPFPELEADDAGVELNRGGLSLHALCVEELDTGLSIHALCVEELKDLSYTLEADDSGITLLLEHGVVSEEQSTDDT